MKISSILYVGCSAMALTVAASVQAAAEPKDPAPAAAQTIPADEPAAPEAEVVVTGSRVITNSNNSPTPLTTVTTEKLTQTTPSSVPDALNKLPSFALSSSVRTSNNPSSNGAGNFLNLRGFGAQRNLILLDGARVPPTAANGTVDINTLPQMLMSRVDVVTGGASAVYGSDAVTGVVNFVLDKKFNGIKALAQAGISDYGDNASYRIGVAAGTSLLDGRMHIEGSYEHYYSAGIQNKLDRPYGQYSYTTTGAGTAASPFHLNINSRLPIGYTPGGYFSIAKGANAGPGALFGDFTFGSNGQLVPFTHGLSSGSTGTESGGDGGFGNMGYGKGADTWLTAKLRSDQAFGRISYDISDHVSIYAQGTYADATNFAIFYPQWFSATILSTNPYLPQSVRDGLAANGTSRFTFSRSFQNQQGSGALGDTRSFNATVGLEGDVGGFRWNAYYTHGDSRLHETDPGNINQEQLFAALDSVVGSNGQIVCRVSTTAAGSAKYPGCQPFNPFGPSSETAGTFQFFDHPTDFVLTNKLDDFAGSIAGTAFNTWAGPVRVAVSGEYRDFSLNIDSNFLPTAKVDCTLLNAQTCPGTNNSNGPLNPATQTPAVWALNVVSPVFAKENVAEIAGEVDVPLLRDMFLAKAFNLNGAVRYTHYSITGNATTWKVGFTWDVNDSIKFRGTRSRDFRAPTLQDLFNPIQSGISSYNDVLTSQSVPNMIVQTQGNPNLKPEVANTLTLGVVFRPTFIPGLSIAADWYKIKIDNAITNVSGTDATVQNECINSGGSSPFCNFFVGRPGPLTDTSPGNLPTTVLSQPFNVAKTETHGVDGEINYHTAAPGLGNGDGNVDLRFLVSYQPKLTQQTLPNAVITDAAGAVGLAEWRLAFNVAYASGPFRIGAEERWHSSEFRSSNPTQVFAEGKIPAIAYTDLNVSYKFGHASSSAKPFETFLSVENLFNKQPALFLGSGLAGAPGFTYPAPRDQDVVGRYFTAGVRARF
jgi:iron complex outermembrane receptor protein